MPIIEFHIPEATAEIKKRVDKALVLVGAQGVSWAANQFRMNGYSPRTPKNKRTSNLVNSLTYSTNKKQGPVRNSKTKGTSLDMPASELTVHIGSNVVYAARVEFGFVGKDSLGRVYNQAAKSYLRAAINAHKEDILNIFGVALNG
jgi:hypothetical protein